MQLLASAARTSSGTAEVAPANFNPELLAGGVFRLDVTAAATDVGDTLDVYLQSTLDPATVAEGDAVWDDFIHFTQVLGNGGAKRFLANWLQRGAAETELHAPSDAALSAGVKQGPVGKRWRVKWAITDAGTDDASFTFGVAFNGIR